MKLLSVLLGLAVVALPTVLYGQDERPPLNPALIPAAGATIETFVPAGWKVEEQISGDLNGDRQGDVALDLIEDIPAENAEGVPNTRMRALVVLLRGSDGSLRRAAVATTLLWCTTCGGMLGDPSGSGGLVRIEKGVLVVDQLSGSREATNQVQRFRWDPKQGAMVMIGLDVVDYDRLNGDSQSTSVNYLTGVRIVEKTRYDKRTDSQKTVSRKKSKVPARTVPIELAGSVEAR